MIGLDEGVVASGNGSVADEAPSLEEFCKLAYVLLDDPKIASYAQAAGRTDELHEAREALTARLASFDKDGVAHDPITGLTLMSWREDPEIEDGGFYEDSAARRMTLAEARLSILRWNPLAASYFPVTFTRRTACSGQPRRSRRTSRSRARAPGRSGDSELAESTPATAGAFAVRGSA